MKPIEFFSRSPEQTAELGKRIGQLAEPKDVLLLIGNLGTGKTCLTQGIARGLGIKEYAASPTFIIVRELYGRLPLYHVDLYRLENLKEIADLGLDDYFYGYGISVIEWADRALNLLPDENLTLNIDVRSEQERRIVFTPHGKRYQDILNGLDFDKI